MTLVATLVYSVLLKPLPYPDSDRLVVLWERRPDLPTLRTVPIADFMDWRSRSNSFESMALYRPFVYDIDLDTAPIRVQVWSVSPEIFSILGTETVIGRTLGSDDGLPGGPATAVISYEFWQSRYGGAPDVLGKILQFPQNPSVAIVGVLAPGSRPPIVSAMVPQVRVPNPAPPLPEIWQAYRPSEQELTNRLRGSYTVVARLKTGVSPETASDEIAAIQKQLATEYPDTNGGVNAGANPLIDEVVGSYRSVLWIFFGAVVFLSLIALGNLTNLQLVRNAARQRELSIRVALGATRGRLARQLLTEAVMLGIVGCAVGLVLAAAGIQILLGYLPFEFPRSSEIGIDLMVVLFSLGSAMAAGIAFGAIPALRACKQEPVDGLKGGEAGAIGRKSNRLLQGLIAFETALALILLIGASLLIHSLWRLTTADTGMNESNVWSVNITLPVEYRNPADRFGFYLRAREGLRRLSEVEAVGLITVPPLAGVDLMLPDVLPEDRAGSAPGREGVALSLRTVTPEYFRIIGVAAERGRVLLDSDAAISEHVAVINQSAARALWPGGDDPIGKRIVSGRQYTVVGVIPDLKMRRLDIAPSPQVYSNFLQEPGMAEVGVTMMVRTRTSNRGFAFSMHSVIGSIDPQVRVNPTTMQDVRWYVTAAERFRTLLLLVFAAIALLLAVVGIFGVVSYAVVQRRREIGVRVALGAGRTSIVGLVVRESMMPALIGLLIGITGSLWMTRVLTSVLYDVTPTDVMTYGTATAVLLTSALCASYFPARRALRVDPVVALRGE
jgi:putative ABC transport system permease protein